MTLIVQFKIGTIIVHSFSLFILSLVIFLDALILFGPIFLIKQPNKDKMAKFLPELMYN